ncbi:MAG: TonB-dependent receptor [Acidobacteriaceae bacterium]|nr:TonB-dependent receptor [Acidobacteriaceae bacterium]
MFRLLQAFRGTHPYPLRSQCPRLRLPFPSTYSRVAATLFFGVTLFGQSTGTVQGTIADATGAIIPNATITITNQATDEKHLLHTDTAGLYSLPSLQPGSYRLEVGATGFQTEVVNDLLIAVGSTTTQNFTLHVGASSQTVEVTSAPPLVEASSISVGSVINQATVQQIPLNGRHFVDLALLTPGTVTPPQNGFLTAPLRGQGSFAFNSAGAREDEINFQINGVNVNDMSQNQITFQPTINTVSSFRLDNSTYDAEYGRNAGSIVNIQTMAGTNSFHGEVYEFLRNSAMDARNFANFSPILQSPFRRNQFGADGGGPLVKNRSFLFLTYEGLIQRQSVPLSTPVLSAQQRAGTYSPVIEKLIPLIPLANSPGNVFTGSAVAPVNIHQGTANFTQVFSEANRFNVYYAMQHDQRNEPPTTQGNNLPGFGDSRQGWRQLLALTDSHIFSPTLVNEARAGFNRIHITFAAENTLSAADYGINSGVASAIGLPQISIGSGSTEFGGINGFPQGRGDDTITLSDTLSWVHGNHNIRFGPEYYHVINDSFSYTPGTFSFANLTAFLNDQPNAFTANTSNRPARIYVNALGAFVQDQWKVTPSFTLNLGLRYDWYGTPNEAENRFVVFDPTTVSLVHVGQGGGPSHAYDESARNFEPRVGFAWNVFGSDKTVLRSAYAIFVDQPITGLVSGLVSNPPYAFPVSSTAKGLTFEDAYTLASGSVAPASVAHNYKDAQVQSWNFNIQQQLTDDLGLMVGYFGSKGTHLNIGRNYNQLTGGVRPYRALSADSPIDPGKPLGNITVYESVGNSSYNALWAQLTKHVSRGLQFQTYYTWSKSIDENSRNVQGVTVQDSYNVLGDRGLSDFDARNRWVLSGIYDLPWKGNRLIDGWEISLIEQIQSGNPINFHTTSTSFTGAQTLRPIVTAPVVSGYSPATNGSPTFVTYLQDPKVFLNQQNAFGNLGRNVIIGPGFSNLDVALTKNTKIAEALTLQFRADAFDLLNQANFGQPGSTVGTSTFGLISGTRFPPGDSGSSRQLQLSMRLTF